MDLSCVGFCGTISTGVLAPATDIYVISLIGAGGFASYSFTAGEEITFTNPFNEDAIAVFQILRNGVPVTSGIYDCFQVKVTAGVSLVTQTEENCMPIYKVYTALLTQTGTDAPVATVLENTLGGAVVWSYIGVGLYRGTLSGAFMANKCFAQNPNQQGWDTTTPMGSGYKYYRVDNNTIELDTSGGDDALMLSPIEIRAYP